MNFYKAYGLCLRSEILLPELRSTSGFERLADAEISLEHVQAGGLEDGEQLGPFLWASPDEFWLQIPGVARFKVSHGKTITIEPASGSDEASIRVFLLGSVLAALLYQRGQFLLHGNSIKIGNSCMICVGPSGAGKSTLAAGFQRRGFSVLADDVVAVDDQFRALPGIPRVKLWQDVIERLEVATVGLDRVRPGMNKFSLSVSNQASEPLPVRWVYVLKNDHIDDIRLDPVFGMAKLMLLRENTYRARYLDGMGLKPQHLQACSGLANQVRVVNVTRPRDGFTLDPLIDNILEDTASDA